MYDNADFNVGTVTGHNTFHSKGGIVCVTPPGIVDSSLVKCTVKIPSAKTVGTFGCSKDIVASCCAWSAVCSNRIPQDS